HRCGLDQPPQQLLTLPQAVLEAPSLEGGLFQIRDLFPEVREFVDEVTLVAMLILHGPGRLPELVAPRILGSPDSVASCKGRCGHGSRLIRRSSPYSPAQEFRVPSSEFLVPSSWLLVLVPGSFSCSLFPGPSSPFPVPRSLFPLSLPDSTRNSELGTGNIP